MYRSLRAAVMPVITALVGALESALFPAAVLLVLAAAVFGATLDLHG